MGSRWLCSVFLALGLVSAAPAGEHALRLAVANTAAESGLVDVLIEVFKRENPQFDVELTVSGGLVVLETARQGSIDAVLTHHRERAWNVWFAWREHLPFDEARARVLLWETVGLHRGLIRHWAESDPDAFARLLQEWEGSGPHSDRWRLTGEFLVDTEHARLRAVLGLPPLEALPPALDQD